MTKKYKCDICGREFNSFGFFKGHITGNHLNNTDEDIEKLKAMITKYNLNVFECKICGQRFLSKTPTDHFFRVHNKRINEKNYTQYLSDVTSTIEQPPIKLDDQQEDEQQDSPQINEAADDVVEIAPVDEEQPDHPVKPSEEDGIPISILDYTLLPDSNLTAVFSRDDGATFKKVFAIGTVQAGDSVVISALVMGDNGILMPAFIIRGFSGVIENNSRPVRAVEAKKEKKEEKKGEKKGWFKLFGKKKRQEAKALKPSEIGEQDISEDIIKEMANLINKEESEEI